MVKMGRKKGEKSPIELMPTLLLVFVSLSFPPFTLAHQYFHCRYPFHDYCNPDLLRPIRRSPPPPPPNNPLLPPPPPPVHPSLPHPPPPKCGSTVAPPPPPPPSPPCPTTAPPPPPYRTRPTPPPPHYCHRECYGDDYAHHYPYPTRHPCLRCPPDYVNPPFPQ